jgi:hypothetical protein
VFGAVPFEEAVKTLRAAVATESEEAENPQYSVEVPAMSLPN